MRLFSVSRELDSREVFQIAARTYGAKDSAEINELADVLLFSLPDVFVSTQIEEAMRKSTKCTAALILLSERFKRGDYGSISEDEADHNTAQRKLGCNTWMTACYDTSVGKIRFETFWDMALYYFDGESIDDIRNGQKEKTSL